MDKESIDVNKTLTIHRQTIINGNVKTLNNSLNEYIFLFNIKK